jgi:Uncharacterized conserved protein
MGKIDFKKELGGLYNTSNKAVTLIDVPDMNFLMVDGSGNPNTAQEYKDAVESLFSLSYTIKFMIKKGETGVDYGVMPLESLWYTNGSDKMAVDDKDSWKWTAMIMQPEYVTEDIFKKALLDVSKKKSGLDISKVRFESFTEGPSVQIMHIGPFTEEGPSVQKLHDFINENGYEHGGKHHEIYLSDIRKGSPKNWKTIIRQPVKNK